MKRDDGGNIMARPLKIYMRGKRVTTLQGILKRMGYPMNDQLGLFGTFTRDAVKDIQKQRSLKVTGMVDEELLQSLQQGYENSEKNSEKKATATYNQQQIDALIRLLVQKNIITVDELQVEMKRPQLVRVNEPPLT